VQNTLTILVLLAAYGLMIFALSLALRGISISPRMAVFWGSLTFGILAGFWAARVWPADIIALVNLPGMLLGDALYGGSIRFIGNPHSSQAHYTIPWLLRVPQVYPLASIAVWGLIGVLAQLAYNQRRTFRAVFLKVCSGARREAL